MCLQESSQRSAFDLYLLNTSTILCEASRITRKGNMTVIQRQATSYIAINLWYTGNALMTSQDAENGVRSPYV